jgi:hypothetical protein
MLNSRENNVFIIHVNQKINFLCKKKNKNLLTHHPIHVRLINDSLSNSGRYICIRGVSVMGGGGFAKI